MKKIVFFISLLMVMKGMILSAQGIIIDHACTDITAIPQSALENTKDSLHIAYGHTSHGSQLTSGMTGLVDFANAGGLGLSLPTDIFDWNNGGAGGALDLHDYAMDGDCGYYPQWVNETVYYLDDPVHADVNVVIWSWCGQVDDKYAAGTLQSEYLTPMAQLEQDYPHVTFIYMTGHVDHWDDANNKAANGMIRDFCTTNNKVLYDFADIESWDPDNIFYEFPHDNCDYYASASGPYLGNWATEWQNSHTLGVDWYDCYAAHSQPLNANQKAYAAWWMWARLAGWNGVATSGYSVYPTSIAFGDVHIDSSAVDTFTLSNNDTIAIVIDSLISHISVVTLTDLGAKLNGFTLATGETRDIQVTFSPLAEETYNGIVTVYSNQDENTDILISGKGVDTPSGGYHVCGEVSGEWNESLIYVDCDVQVLNSHTLVINPPVGGTDIIFTGHYMFSVYGRILVNGNEQDSVRFTAQDSSEGWFGLRCYDLSWNGMDSSKISHTSLEYGKANGTGWENGYGGAMFIYESSPLLIEHCLFENNYANDGGGAIHVRYSSPIIRSCILRENSATHGGGFELSGSSGNVEYCLLYYNTASMGAGIYINGCSPDIHNCTFSNNTASSNGGALVLYDWSYPTLTNCILWDDSPEEIYLLVDGGEPITTYSNIQGAWTGSGNINTDPLFMNTINNNFHLTEHSPCIDTGDPASPLDPDGTRCDMGSLYYDQTVLSAPENILISINSDSVHIKWDHVAGASSYNIYSSGQPQTGFIIEASEITENSWSEEILHSERFYYITTNN